MYQDAIQQLFAASLLTPHRIGDGCECWRCIAHRIALQVALHHPTENAEFAAHLDATRRRARRSAARQVKTAA